MLNDRCLSPVSSSLGCLLDFFLLQPFRQELSQAILLEPLIVRCQLDTGTYFLMALDLQLV